MLYVVCFKCYPNWYIKKVSDLQNVENLIVHLTLIKCLLTHITCVLKESGMVSSFKFDPLKS